MGLVLYSYIIWTIGLVIWIVLSIVPRIITFWSEKGLVIKDINNWFSTNTIMRYILRNINNKFNIFSLPKGSTNITLSESIFSLLLSLVTVLIIILPKMV